MINCKFCNSKKTIKKGFYKKEQRWQCKDCGKTFIKKNENIFLNNENMKQTLISERPKKVDELLKEFDIDTNIWKIKKFDINKWNMLGKEGKINNCYQMKLYLEQNNDLYNLKKLKEDYKNFVKQYVPKYKKINYNFKKQKENNLLEINISDLHLGKLCWYKETGENFDIDIAQKRFIGILEKTIERVSVFNYNRILFPVGNDFFNSDNLNNTTTYGTPQDEDVRWQRSYKIGRELLIRAIDYLKQYAPVDVVIVQGNHDFQKMYYLGDALELWYSKCEDVTINNKPKVRKYYIYDNILIGYTHGGQEKTADLPLIMAQEVPELWSKTKYREMHIGHLHFQKNVKYISLEEHKGVIIRQFRSPTGTDAWHAKKGFVGSLKGASALLWSGVEGLIACFEINL